MLKAGNVTTISVTLIIDMYHAGGNYEAKSDVFPTFRILTVVLIRSAMFGATLNLVTRWTIVIFLNTERW